MRKILLALVLAASTTTTSSAQEVSDDFKLVFDIKTQVFRLRMPDGYEAPIVRYESHGHNQHVTVYRDVDDVYCGSTFKIHQFTIQFTCDLD